LGGLTKVHSACKLRLRKRQEVLILMKRIILFVATNFAVMLLLSLVCQVLGLDRYLAMRGVQFGPLLVLGAVFGFGGAFISLLMSKWMAKMAMGVRVIAQPANSQEGWLLATVERLAQQAGVGMPEVGIFESPEPNAFATGASRNHALVAVSRGLLQAMNHDEVEAVLGHELTHVANGDMVTLTLLQGVLNTFVFALSRAVAAVLDRDDRRGMAYFLTVIAAQIVLGALASLIVLWFSRQREYRADAGGARLAGAPRMIAALEALKRFHGEGLPAKQLQAFGISGGDAGWSKLFMSHPPLDERIAALRAHA
jgi:heat shock protein HtpX